MVVVEEINEYGAIDIEEYSGSKGLATGVGIKPTSTFTHPGGILADMDPHAGVINLGSSNKTSTGGIHIVPAGGAKGAIHIATSSVGSKGLALNISKKHTRSTSSSLFMSQSSSSLFGRRPSAWERLHNRTLQKWGFDKKFHLNLPSSSTQTGQEKFRQQIAKHLKPITPPRTVKGPGFWERFSQQFEEGLSKAGEKVLTATTQAAAQALAYKIQKSLGVTPEIRKTSSGYQVVVPQGPVEGEEGEVSSGGGGLPRYPVQASISPTTTQAGTMGNFMKNPLFLLGGLLLLVLLLRR